MPTRREFLWGSAAAAGAIALAGYPFQGAEAAPGTDFVAWHNRTLEQHIQMRDQYAKQGYRFRSVSIYGGGQANSCYFAAVMVRRPSVVAQRDWPLLRGDGFQRVFEAQAKEGFGPVILAACGPASNPAFSAVFEPQKAIPLTRVGLGSGDPSDDKTIQGMNAQAKKQGLILRWAASYGDARQPSFAGIWAPNPGGVGWNCDGVLDAQVVGQQRFDAEAAAWCRPSLITLNQDGRYLQLFENNQIGEWYARSNMDAAGYQSAFQEASGKGFYPMTVQAAGADRERASFAAVFVRSEEPVGRKWSATGPVANAEIDAAMRKAMMGTPVRQAALAIVQGTQLVYARGYTLAEPGWPVVEPTTYFRLASVSKTVASLALFQLFESGELHLGNRLQDILRLETPAGGQPGPRFAKITLAELFEHTSMLDPDGYRDSVAIVNAFRKAGKAAKLPVSVEMTDSYIASLRLQAGPQAMYYSNCGYHLLGRVLAKKRGTRLTMDAIQKHLLEPLSITRIRSSVSLLSAQHPDEGRQQDPDLGLAPSVMTPQQPLVPRDYGDWNMEVDESAGGFSGAVPDVARLVAVMIDQQDTPVLKRSTLTGMFDMAVKNQMNWKGRTKDLRAGYGLDAAGNLGGGQYYGQKGGSGIGWGDWVEFNGDWGLVVCLGGVGAPNWGDNAYPDFPDVMNIARKASWGEDLFPRFGMPALARSPRVRGR